ncbi:MAG: hypothetical protein IH592_01775 [Bacteroidales bacterium]|nr:hypothetical protein [Bacteroidales bacterium]
MIRKTSRILQCIILLLAALMLSAQGLNAQVLDYQNKVEIVLNDGTHVILYGKAKSLNNTYTGEYYYLPVGLQLSHRTDGTPEFLFLKYTTEQRAEAGGAQGGLIHFLMSWGLTQAQLQEAQAKLVTRIADLAKTPGSPYKGIQNPKIMGAVDVYTEDESFRIISASLTDADDARLITSGSAPTLPGSKVAVAGKLNAVTAQLLAATFEKNRSITDISLELNFMYNVMMPAVNGKITVDWSKIQEQIKTDSIQYSHNTRGTKRGSDDRYSYDQLSQFYSRCIEKKAVVIDIDKTVVGDELADKIVEQFMNLMIESMTDKDMSAVPTQPSEKEKGEDPNVRHGASYVYNRTVAEKRYERKIEVYNLNYRLTVPKNISLTSNLGAWYDGVRDNPKCVSSVNLNDPFFQYRDINLILDIEAESMFGDEVNYVTVNVRKQRTSGNPFEDHVTIDREYLRNSGVKATMTYARGEDTNPDAYEYKAQWSLKGGNIYPPSAPWVVGEWEGVTLSPPIKPVTVELEGDLDELKSSEITRVTAQVHFMKFGKEVEENIQLSVAAGEPVMQKTIYIDKNTRGYVYRLIFNHKTEGKLALDWTPQINDNYIYASIPEDMVNKESEVFKAAKETGSEILQGSKEKVLDKFRDIFDKVVK